jgi:hypothetical protein
VKIAYFKYYTLLSICTDYSSKPLVTFKRRKIFIYFEELGYKYSFKTYMVLLSPECKKIKTAHSSHATF